MRSRRMKDGERFRERKRAIEMGKERKKKERKKEPSRISSGNKLHIATKNQQGDVYSYEMPPNASIFHTAAQIAQRVDR